MIIAGVATAPVTMPAMALAVAKGLVIKVGIEIVGLAAEKMKCAELTYGTIELGNATYTGDLKDCKPHGQGTAIWSNGQKYVGEWKDGEEHGHGTGYYANGQKYVGEWKDGEEHGHGTLTWPDGAKYVGEFKDGDKHGNGTMTWPGGDRFVGEYRYDERYKGTYIWADGTKETIRP